MQSVSLKKALRGIQMQGYLAFILRVYFLPSHFPQQHAEISH